MGKIEMKSTLLMASIIAVLAIVLWQVLESRAEYKVATEQLAKTVSMQDKEIKLKEKINVDSRKRLEELKNETIQLSTDLGKLKVTPVQHNCDFTSTPAGYADRVFRNLNKIERDFSSR